MKALALTNHALNKSSKNFLKIQSKNLNKSNRPTFYNLRLYFSNLRRNHIGYEKWDMVYGPDGFEKVKTDRNPNNFKYRNNMLHHTAYEMRHIFGDMFYQVYRRLNRIADPFHLYALPASLSTLYLVSNQHFCFKSTFFFMFFAAIGRTLSKTEEPHLDEIWLRDLLLKHEVVGKYLKFDTHHVIDMNMEFDKGLGNPYFPEYRTRIAKFFNTDTNTTTGFYKFGDLETGAIVTVHFKTMPYSANQYWYSDPFLVYDLVAEISCNGQYLVEHIIKAEDTLKNKRIFVPLF